MNTGTSPHALPLPGTPTVPALAFRPILGAPDAEALCAVRAASAAHDRIDPLSVSESLPGVARLRAALSQACAEGAHDRWRVAQAGEQVVGYSHILDWSEADGTRVYLLLGWVLPAWRGRGIGTALLHWAEDRARHLAAAGHPGARFEFAANASSTEADATQLLLHEGYRAGYTVLEMELDPSAPVPSLPLPPGIDVRPVAPDHYLPIAASVDEAYLHEFEGGRFQDTSDPEAYAQELSAPPNDPTLWQVAWAGDEVAGQVLAIVHDNGVGELFEVSVRPAWRRRGLGRALLTRALTGLRARGVQTIRLRTVAEFRTRASDLYRSVGFRLLKEFPRYRKPAGQQPSDWAPS